MRALARSAQRRRAALRARQRRDRGRRRACSTSAPTTSRAIVAAARARGVRPGRRRPRGAARRRARGRARGRRASPAFGPGAERRAARGLEGPRQGADGRGRRADRGAHGAAQPRGGARAIAGASYPAVLKADGLAAGKGVIICARRGARRARRSRRSSSSAASATPRSCWRSSSTARSSRCSRSATARTWSPLAPAQDYKRIFDGDGARTPAAWAATRRCRASTGDGRARSSTPCTGRSSTCMARRGHPVPRRPLRRADAHRRRAQGARVQLPLRRPRDAGGAAAAALATCSSCSSPRASRAGSPGLSADFAERLGGDGGPRLRRLPGVAPRRAT